MGPDARQDLTLAIELPGPVDLRRTLGLLPMGPGDPTMQLESDRLRWALRTPVGPASLDVAVDSARARAEAAAWGPGGGWLLDRVADLLGLSDDPAAFSPEHLVVREWARRFPGLRLARVPCVLPVLAGTILQQLVPWQEASGAWSGLVRRYGEAAPGPFDLALAPAPEVLARLGTADFVGCGALPRQGATIRQAARVAGRVEEARELPFDAALSRLLALEGVGPWTAGTVAVRALGHADAVPTGDFHLPNDVAFALAGEPRADDRRMLELLEPFRGQRGRVLRLLRAADVRAPRFGPRHAFRKTESR